MAGTLTVPDTPFLEQNLVLPTTQKSVLQVRTEPDATISVDGVAVGNGTFKSTVSAGLHKVEVQLGEKEYHLEQTVDLSAGDQVVDMYLSSPLTIVYPPSAQFIIVPKEGATGEAFWAGIYNTSTTEYYGNISVNLKNVQPGYQWYELSAKWPPHGSDYIWMGPPRFTNGKSPVEAVYLDRIEIIENK